jgi:hypothetical protein
MNASNRVQLKPRQDKGQAANVDGLSAWQFLITFGEDVKHEKDAIRFPSPLNRERARVRGGYIKKPR